MEIELIYNYKVIINEECLKLGGSFFIFKKKPVTASKENIEKTYELLKDIKDPVLLDIGANTGSFSLLAKFIPQLKIYSFEPAKKVFEILVNHVELNELSSRVKTYNLACYHEKTQQILKCCYKRESGLSTLGEKFKRSNCYTEEVVETDTIDNIVEKEKINKVDFIKIDTEGCEFFVLTGAEKTIKHFKPIILTEAELQNTQAFDYTPERILEVLARYGYSKVEYFSKRDILAFY